MESYADLPNLHDNKSLARQTRLAMNRGLRDAIPDLKMYDVVHTIHWLGYYVKPIVCLVTSTDVERDGIVQSGIPRELVLKHLRQAGVRADLAARAGFTVESKQTVDRDFGGNWWHAIK